MESKIEKISYSFKVTVQILLVLCAMVGCGGGGGGGGSDDGGSGKSAATGVRILHGAIEGAPVDLYSPTGAAAIGNGKFGEIPIYISLPTGASPLTLTTRFVPSQVLYTGAVTLEKNQHASLLLYGDETNFGLQGTVLSDEPGEIPDGSFAVRVVDSVVGASAILGSVGGESISSGTSFGSASPYAFQGAGLKDYLVRRSFDSRVISRGSFTFESGKAYTIFVTGEIDYLVVTRILED